MGKVIVYKDDREKQGYTAETLGPNFEIETKRLKTGDYTIKGMDKIFVIERKKNWSELLVDFGRRDVERTGKMLQRLKKIPYHFMLVHDDIVPRHQVYTPGGATHATRMRYIYTQLLLVHRVNIQFVGGNNEGLVVRRIFNDFYNLKKKGLL